MKLFLGAITAATFILAAGCWGQEITGTIVGSVLDTSGAGVPKAKVVITNTDRNAIVRTAISGTDGYYVASVLPIGHYAVTTEMPGFKRAAQRDIVLNVNDKLTINLRLEIGDVTQEVTVTAEGVEVELQSPTSQNLIDGKQITELSLNARNYEQLVGLMPGVTFTGTDDQIYVGTSNPLTGQSNA